MLNFSLENEEGIRATLLNSADADLELQVGTQHFAAGAHGAAGRVPDLLAARDLRRIEPDLRHHERGDEQPVELNRTNARVGAADGVGLHGLPGLRKGRGTRSS